MPRRNLSRSRARVAIGDGPVLLADIGGTHARFALADPAAAAPLLYDSIEVQPIAACASLAEAALGYLRGRNARVLGPLAGDVRVRRAIFAIAGPVLAGDVRMTNHPWRVSGPQLRRALDLDDVVLVNDFAAQAMALRLLRDEDLVSIGPPATQGTFRAGTGTRLVLGPGTGLGAAALVSSAGRDVALATEAGHLAFAPGDDREVAILRSLAARFGRVSNERLLSGEGLVNLHRALAGIAGQAVVSDLKPADISAGARAGDARCERTVALFCDLLGAVAGDLVLALGAWDGVFLSGGVLPHVLPILRRSGFRRRFQDKGRYTEAIARVPTRVVVHPHPGLLGAAAMAVPDRVRKLHSGDPR